MKLDVIAVHDPKAGWQIKALVGGRYQWLTPAEAIRLRDRLTRIIATTRKSN